MSVGSWVMGGGDTYTHAHGDLLTTLLLFEGVVEDNVHEDLQMRVSRAGRHVDTDKREAVGAQAKVTVIYER